MPSLVRRTPPRARLRAEALEDRTVPTAVPGLVAWWTGDDTGQDASGHGHTAAAYNGAGYAPAVVNDGFEFDGVDDYQLVADAPDLRFTTAFTIEGWIRVDQLPPPGYASTIVNKDSQLGGQRAYSFEVTADGRLYAEVFGNGTDASAAIRWSSAPVPVGAFVHVAVVYDGPAGRHDLYINGQLSDGTQALNSGTFPSSLFTNTEPVQIGAYRQAYFAHSFSDMAIDELKMYDRALTGSEVAAEYSSAVSVNHAPTADAGGPYATTYGGSVTLSGTGSDADGDSLTYTWTVNGSPAATGPIATLSWAQLQAAGVTAAGTYPVSLTADDGHGGVATSAEVTLTVNKATPVVSVIGGSFVYDEQAHPATGSVTGVLGEDLGTPTFTYTFTDNNGNVVTTGAPVEPGYYTVTASFAGNANYNPASTTATITIAFEVRTLTDLSKAFHAGRTIPIKLQLVDATGTNVSSAGITVTALRLDRVNADGSRTQVALQDAGNVNPGNLFRYDAALGGYIFNLSTKGLGAGTYEFSWTADGDPTEHTLSFRLV
jgi:hypothetical protein